MNLLTIDFETYYDQDFSLSKITTEEYIRSPAFEVIGVGVKVNNEKAVWASGDHASLKKFLEQLPWEDSLVLAHNTMFDGAILAWVFGLQPRMWLDTLCMGRAIHGVEVGGSLKALAERYQIGEKGTEVINAKGKRRVDFTEDELSRYGDYCLNDVEITHKLFHILGKNFPKKELRIIHTTLQMFINPVLQLDTEMLSAHLQKLIEFKGSLLDASGLTREDIMSNSKFAAQLRKLGVKPPTKKSLRTGKETLALSKTDQGLLDLQDHPDPQVQAIVAARLGVKSTLEETRTQRFLEIASRGDLPVPIRYYAAHTGRFGGDDKINLQNLPSRGPYAKTLKRSILAPDGYVIIDADSSQIEARVLAWLAEQDDVTKTFSEGGDVYKKMASAIYGVSEDQITKQQRFVGKTAVLGCGYGLGAQKFKDALSKSDPPMDIDIDEARRIIQVYRFSNDRIVSLWRSAQNMLDCMVRNDPCTLGRAGVLKVLHEQNAIELPSGLLMRYDGLRTSTEKNGEEFSYLTRRGETRIYGGKVIENVCQAIARCIIAEQMLLIAKRYKVVLTVHDAVACIAPEADAGKAMAYVVECMRWTPEWAQGLPVNCEAGFAKRYGDC
jgi:DNA polymerase